MDETTETIKKPFEVGVRHQFSKLMLVTISSFAAGKLVELGFDTWVEYKIRTTEAP